MIRNDLFETPIWSTQVELDINTLIKIFDEAVKNNYTALNSSTDGSIQTQNLCKTDAFKDIKINIEEIFKDETNQEVSITSAWICKNPPGSRNKNHIHGACDLSGVYYIQTPKNSGDIVFSNPNPIVQHKELYNKDKCFWHQYKLEPVEKGILFFPCWVPHEVETNKSEKNRLALSFNMVYI
jgi:uncharacterized protein (TIGR02466 family)|tara:strand:+ start:2424 stop:2969 length:546 start_codon:yes stop_codon:yes gene_type:complete